MAQTSRIYVERGETARLAKIYGVTQQTVRQALRCITNTDTAEKIRQDALKGGGFVIKRKIKI